MGFWSKLLLGASDDDLAEAKQHREERRQELTAELPHSASSALEELFSGEGRIGRGRYWQIEVSLVVLNLVVSLLMLLIMAPNYGDSPAPALLLGFILLVPLAWVQGATLVKRWHDLGKSGWFAWTVLIPYVNLVILLYLGLAKGAAGSNRYGENPITLRDT